MSLSSRSTFLILVSLQVLVCNARATRPWKSCTKKFQPCYSAAWAAPPSMSGAVSMPCCNRYDTCLVKNYYEAECVPEAMLDRMRDDPQWDMTQLDLDEMPETVLGGPKCEMARQCYWCEVCSGKDDCTVSTFDGKPVPPSAVTEDDPEGFIHMTGFYDSDYLEDEFQVPQGPVRRSLLTTTPREERNPPLSEPANERIGELQLQSTYAYVSMSACVDICRNAKDCNMIHWWNQQECSGEECYGRCNRYAATKKWCPGMACPTVSNEGSVDHTFIKKSACPHAYPADDSTPPMQAPKPTPAPAPALGNPDTPGSYP